MRSRWRRETAIRNVSDSPGGWRRPSGHGGALRGAISFSRTVLIRPARGLDAAADVPHQPLALPLLPPALRVTAALVPAHQLQLRGPVVPSDDGAMVDLWSVCSGQAGTDPVSLPTRGVGKPWKPGRSGRTGAGRFSSESVWRRLGDWRSRVRIPAPRWLDKAKTLRTMPGRFAVRPSSDKR